MDMYKKKKNLTNNALPGFHPLGGLGLKRISTARFSV
jgi:hypothetical protein